MLCVLSVGVSDDDGGCELNKPGCLSHCVRQLGEPLWCADNFRCASNMETFPNDLEEGMRIVCCAHNLMPLFGQTCAK